MKTKHFLTALFTSILLVFASLATADSMDLANKRITELNVYSGASASGDLVPIWDASAAKVKTSSASIFGIVAETTTAANVITATENGTIYYVSGTSGYVATLPAPVAGMKFKFVLANLVSSGAQQTVVTNGSSNIIRGGFTTADIDGAADADWETSGGDTISFVSSADSVGDNVECNSDGTYWYCTGSSKTYNALTITTAS